MWKCDEKSSEMNPKKTANQNRKKKQLHLNNEIPFQFNPKSPGSSTSKTIRLRNNLPHRFPNSRPASISSVAELNRITSASGPGDTEANIIQQSNATNVDEALNSTIPVTTSVKSNSSYEDLLEMLLRNRKRVLLRDMEVECSLLDYTSIIDSRAEPFNVTSETHHSDYCKFAAGFNIEYLIAYLINFHF